MKRTCPARCRRIMVSAGEVSGDVHGAYLVHEIKKLSPDIYFFGMGSENLLSEGVDIKFDITLRGTIGLFEALPNILPIYFVYLKLVALLKKERPDLLLLIDSQGINVPLAKAAKKLGVKTVYYIAPQEWLWGTFRGARSVAKTVDLIISIFIKEHEVYKSAGANSVFFGHPLLDIVKKPDANIIKNIDPVIALCPGSRKQEIDRLFPILLKAAELIKKEIPSADFIVPAASDNVMRMLFKHVGDPRPRAFLGRTYEALAKSDLAICASGTINLEASILGVPNIMVYKLSPATYFIGKYVLKIDKKLPFFSMPNLLMNENIVPELIMRDANPKKVADASLSILKDPSIQNQMKNSFDHLKTRLGPPGAIAHSAKAILEML